MATTHLLIPDTDSGSPAEVAHVYRAIAPEDPSNSTASARSQHRALPRPTRILIAVAQFGSEAELFGPDLRAWEELFTQPLILGGGGSWVNGRHRAALIAASGAQYVALADPRWRPHWE